MSKRLSRFAVGDAAIGVREQPGYSNRMCVAWGDTELLDAIASQAGFPPMHPLNRHKRVLGSIQTLVTPGAR